MGGSGDLQPRGAHFCRTYTAVLACISHQLSAAVGYAPHPAGFSRLGVFDVLSITTPSPARPGRSPQRRPLRAPWPRTLGAATTAMSFHRRGEATTKTGPWRRNPSGRWGSWPISALLVVDDARASTPPRALTSTREPRRRTALGAPAGPLGRKNHWVRHPAALATKAGEKCRLTNISISFLSAVRQWRPWQVFSMRRGIGSKVWTRSSIRR